MLWFLGCISVVSIDNLYLVHVYIYLSNFKPTEGNWTIPFLIQKFILQTYRASYVLDIVLSINSFI